MKINEVAKLTGVTVRTLQYYDKIGLLVPSDMTPSGYRIYNEDSLSDLQQILFFRELGFSLRDIKEIMTNSHYDKQEALKKHKEILLQKSDRLNQLIILVDNTIKGDNTMNFNAFDMTKIEENKKKYAAEVKDRWGSTAAFQESQEKTENYDSKKWNMLNEESGAILKAFGENRQLSPDSQQASQLVKQWQAYITANFYNCTKEILAGLGLMYIEDERFKQNIDQYGEGTAAFMEKAIESYCNQ